MRSVLPEKKTPHPAKGEGQRKTPEDIMPRTEAGTKHQANNDNGDARSLKKERCGARHPISVRPTAAQLAWLKEQRSRRGLAINALVLLALEQAMAADPIGLTDGLGPEVA